jgi:hypothetical protein
MTTARSGIDKILDDIMRLEGSIMTTYGRTAGRVRIANARTATSYTFNKSDDFMRWHVEYLSNLKSQL